MFEVLLVCMHSPKPVLCASRAYRVFVSRRMMWCDVNVKCCFALRALICGFVHAGVRASERASLRACVRACVRASERALLRV
eukprot:6194662-Pleurochrysis_carterae.AAC.2